MGYKFQFVTLAGFHALNLSMFELARGYKDSGMTAYSRLQEKEFSRETRVRIPGREAPALRGHRILRRAHAGDRWWPVLNHGAERLHRAGTVRRDEAEVSRAPETWSGRSLPADSGECPSTNVVHEIIPIHEESLLPSGD